MLCQAAHCKIVVVLARYHSGCDDDKSSLERLLPKVLQSNQLVGLPTGTTGLKKHDPTLIVMNVLRWCTESFPPGEARLFDALFFIAVLAHFPRSRLLSTIWQPAVHGRPQLPFSTYSSWLERLVKEDLIRLKPGGLIWFRTKCRGKLREAVFDIEAFVKALEPSRSDDPDTEVLQLAQSLDIPALQLAMPDLRVVHRRIADWYLHVFDATGAPTALFDAADQLAEIAHHELWYSKSLPPSDQQQAILGVEAVCAQVSEILREQRHLLEMQGYSKGSCRRLSRLRDRLAQLRITLTELGALNGMVDALVRDSLLTCTAVMRGIAREVGELRTAFTRHRELRSILMTGQWIDEWDSRNLPSWASPTTEIAYQMEVRLRWFRWSAGLAVASRSYDNARHFLNKAVRLTTQGTQGAGLPHSGPSISSESAWAALLSQMASTGFQSSSGPAVSSSSFNSEVGTEEQESSVTLSFSNEYRRSQFLEWLRVQEMFVACELLKASQNERFTSLRGYIAQPQQLHLNTESTHDVGEARRIAGDVLRLTGDLPTYTGPPFEPSAGDEPAVATRLDLALSSGSAIWSRARLLMHLAVADIRCEASKCVSPEELENVAHRALGYLARAETVLSKGLKYRQMTDRGVLELHRAEVMIYKAGCIRLGGDKDKYCFKDYVAKWLHQYRDPVDYLHCEPEKDPSLHSVLATLYDTMRFLDRAQPMLRNFRRNVWWNSWLIERRLRVIGQLVLVSASTSGEAIPYLGLEASCRKAMTEADDLLQEALRLVRVDSYRLACIVEAYGLCLLALQFKLDKDQTSVRLPDRVHRMTVRLQDGLRVLHNVHHRRKDAVVSRANEKDEVGHGDMELDPRTIEYIKQVMNHTAKILDRFVVVC